MLTFKVSTDFSEAKRALTDIQKKLVPRAAGTALNRVGTTVRAQATRKIRERLAIKAAVSKGSIAIKRAGSQRLAVELQASGKPIPLRDYQARMTRKGATFRVSKAGGRKRYIRKERSGFILANKGGHVFVRIEDDPPGPKKALIKKVFGPSIPQYFVTKIVEKVMRDTAEQRWPIEFKAALRGIILNRTGVDINVQ